MWIRRLPLSTLSRQPRVKRDVLSITENAATRIKELLSSRQDEQIVGIRLGVKSRGCSGKSYTMNYATGPNKGDEIVEQRGVKLFVDSKAVIFLVGTVVDYVEDHLKSEFIFTNPNAKGSCGCGESFNT